MFGTSSDIIYIPLETHQTFGYWWSSTIQRFIAPNGRTYIYDKLFAFTDTTLNAIIAPKKVV